MPRLRTAVALLFHVLLLQLSVLGGGMACATGWAERGAAARGEHAHAAPSAHAAHDAGHDAAAHDDAPAPRHDGVPPHCATAAGCTVAAAPAPHVVAIATSTVRTVAEAGRVSLPASVRPAPEPPPPRG